MKHVVELENLRAKRAQLHTEMKEINASAVNEARDLTAEEAAEYDKREADFDALTSTIRREEKLAGFDGVDPSARGNRAADEGEEQIESRAKRAKENPFASDEYRDAYQGYLRAGDNMDAETRAALIVGAAANGGYTVAQEWERTLVESLRDFGVVRELATVITTSDSGQLHVPAVVDSPRGVATLTTEGNPFTESEDTFSEVTLDSYKMGEIIKVSDELLHDSIFDISGFVISRGAIAIGVKENTYYMAGTGTAQPNGLVNATVGKTTATNSAITASELIDMYHSLRRAYRQRASWIFNDSTVKVIRKLTDSGTGAFTWQPGLQAGAPDTLLGRPVYTDPDVPVIATTAVVGIFGDISAYWIRDVAPMNVKVLNELYAGNGYVGYRLDRRSDGDIVDGVAIRTLKMAV